MCCILVSKWARRSNGALLDLNMWSSLTVITQSIYQEWQYLCFSCQQLHDIAVINLSYQKHCSIFCNSLVVMHLLALSWLTNAVHIYQASIIVIVYVFPVSWYCVCTCMQDGRYHFLHTRAKWIAYTVIIWYK